MTEERSNLFIVILKDNLGLDVRFFTTSLIIYFIVPKDLLIFLVFFICYLPWIEAVDVETAEATLATALLNI